MERPEQIEQLAQKLWHLRNGYDVERIEQQSGESHLEWEKWEALSEKVKDCLRDMAEKKQASLDALPPPTEMERYLNTLFAELERLRPTHYGPISHGIAWDRDWDRLVFIMNCGDVASLHPLTPDRLTADPIATAASLIAEARAANEDDLDYIGIKS